MFVSRECFKSPAGPVSVIDLVQGVTLLDVKFHALRDCVGGLNRAFEWTAVERIQLYAVESLRKLLCLKLSFFIQTNALCADPMVVGEPAARRMSDEKESGHAIALAG